MAALKASVEASRRPQADQAEEDSQPRVTVAGRRRQADQAEEDSQPRVAVAGRRRRAS